MDEIQPRAHKYMQQAIKLNENAKKKLDGLYKTATTQSRYGGGVSVDLSQRIIQQEIFTNKTTKVLQDATNLYATHLNMTKPIEPKTLTKNFLNIAADKKTEKSNLLSSLYNFGKYAMVGAVLISAVAVTILAADPTLGVLRGAWQWAENKL